MEGNTTVIYYKDLTQEEKDHINNVERAEMRKKREAFIKDERFKGIDPEDVWYLKNDYINNWTFDDEYLFTKCECGSLEFATISEELEFYGLSRKCLMKCKKCGRVHLEYN